MRCPNEACGASLVPGARFCSRCGCPAAWMQNSGRRTPPATLASAIPVPMRAVAAAPSPGKTENRNRAPSVAGLILGAAGLSGELTGVVMIVEASARFNALIPAIAALVLSLAGLVLSAIGMRRKGVAHRLGVAGFTLSVLGLALGAMILIFLIGSYPQTGLLQDRGYEM